MWQTPPEGTWQALQQRLDWLHLAMSNAKEMFQGLRRHWNLLEYQNRVTEAVDLMKVCCPLLLSQQVTTLVWFNAYWHWLGALALCC